MTFRAVPSRETLIAMGAHWRRTPEIARMLDVCYDTARSWIKAAGITITHAQCECGQIYSRDLPGDGCAICAALTVAAHNDGRFVSVTAPTLAERRAIARRERVGGRRERLEAVREYANTRWIGAAIDVEREHVAEFWRSIVHRLDDAFALADRALIRDVYACERPEAFSFPITSRPEASAATDQRRSRVIHRQSA